MCGIAGIVRLGGVIGPEDIAATRRVMAAQVHRGPDDHGLYHDERVVLGNLRLAIIDLSPPGRQPMSNENGTVWVTYNGEIYNYRELRRELVARGHRFTSHTDTEVIIHGYEEWGVEGVLSRLRGMFAFALYDNRSSAQVRTPAVFLARDRLGIKPLYYFLSPDGDRLAFASEVKALLRSALVPTVRDPEAVFGFLLLGAVPSPFTTVKGVRGLPPGHYLMAGEQGVQPPHKFWDIQYTSTDSVADGDAIAADLRLELEDTVARHLVSDAPLGVFLSGGIDSAGLLALASPAASPLRTLTVVFAEKEFDEREQARRVAERFGAEHIEVPVSDRDFARELPEILEVMDQPTNDGVNTYFISQAARQAGLTVVLSGVGGDEVFWGYRHYRWLARPPVPVRVLCQLPGSIRRGLLQSAAAYGSVRGPDRLARLAHLSDGLSPEGLYLLMRGFFAPQQIRRLLDLDAAGLRAGLQECLQLLRPPSLNGTAASNAFHYLELKRYLHDQLLRDTDAFGMAHSIEVRVPYLDHLIVERVARIAPAVKLDHAMNKPLLVRALGDPLFTAIGRRAKRGFVFPLAHWMHRHAGQLEAMALEASFLNRSAVRRMWRAFRAGRLHWSRAWALVVLGATVQPGG